MSHLENTCLTREVKKYERTGESEERIKRADEGSKTEQIHKNVVWGEGCRCQRREWNKTVAKSLLGRRRKTELKDRLQEAQGMGTETAEHSLARVCGGTAKEVRCARAKTEAGEKRVREARMPADMRSAKLYTNSN